MTNDKKTLIMKRTSCPQLPTFLPGYESFVGLPSEAEVVKIGGRSDKIAWPTDVCRIQKRLIRRGRIWRNFVQYLC